MTLLEIPLWLTLTLWGIPIFFSTGFVYWATTYSKKGKTYIKDGRADLTFNPTDNTFQSLKISLQFVNDSGHTRQINTVGADLIYKINKHRLTFSTHTFNPIITLKERLSFQLVVEATLYEGTLNLSALDASDCKVKITYVIKGKTNEYYIVNVNLTE
jgi:hypothetical protein